MKAQLLLMEKSTHEGLDSHRARWQWTLSRPIKNRTWAYSQYTGLPLLMTYTDVKQYLENINVFHILLKHQPLQSPYIFYRLIKAK